MIKLRKAKGRASVTFTLDPQVKAQTAAVCGEWNDWSADIDLMHRDPEGGFSLKIDLEAGRSHRFRYLLHGERWENDWAADAYVPNAFGGDDSVVDLTSLATGVPPTTKKTPAKKATAKKTTSPSKAASAKSAKKGALPTRKGANRKT